jgi:hypothetical protein
MMLNGAPKKSGAETFMVTRIGVEKTRSVRVSKMNIFSSKLSPPSIFAPKRKRRRVRLQESSQAFACHISTIHDSESDVEGALQ